MTEKTTPNRVLIVSAYFAPDAKIGAQRPTRVAGTIGRLGWKPYVLTTAVRCAQDVDTSADMTRLSDVIVRRVPCGSPWMHSRWWRDKPPGWRRWLAMLYRGLTKPTQGLLPTDEMYPWVLRATRAGVRLVEREGIDLIWATAPPVSPLLLAHRIAERTGVPFVADFRDVRGTGPPAGRQQRKAVEIERRALSAAAGLTVSAPVQAERLKSIYPEIASLPHRVVYNWFEPDAWRDITPETFEFPTMLHGGTLYGGRRRVDGVLDAMALLRRSGDTCPQLLQYGRPETVGNLLQKVEQRGLGDVVHVHGLIPSEQFRAKCAGADILLLPVGHSFSRLEHAGSVPGKLFDYFAAGRPILVVGPPHCHAGQLVEQTRRGIAVRDDQPDAIAEAIGRLLRKEGTSGPLDLTPKAVEGFSAESAMTTLSEFLKGLLKCCE